jgi:hypothetical protein
MTLIEALQCALQIRHYDHGTRRSTTRSDKCLLLPKHPYSPLKKLRDIKLSEPIHAILCHDFVLLDVHMHDETSLYMASCIGGKVDIATRTPTPIENSSNVFNMCWT